MVAGGVVRDLNGCGLEGGVRELNGCGLKDGVRELRGVVRGMGVA